MSELIFLEPKWLFGLIALPVAWLFWRFKRQASQGPVAAHLSQTPTKGAKHLVNTIVVERLGCRHPCAGITKLATHHAPQLQQPSKSGFGHGYVAIHVCARHCAKPFTAGEI